MSNSLTRAALIVAAPALLLACSDGTSAPSGASSATTLDAVSVAATTVTIGFNGAMMPGMDQFIDLHHGDVTGPVIPMACAWSADYSTLTCTPSTTLVPGDHYTVHMGAGMRGSNGMPIDMAGGTGMGGTWMSGGMGDGHHGPMMGGGWQDTDGHDGMLFPFTPT